MTAVTATAARSATYFYASVSYTDGLLGQAARDSYKGVNVEVTYGQTAKGTMTFNSGDFVYDYNGMLAFVADLSGDRDVPFFGSSSVDSYMFDAGYTTESGAEAAYTEPVAETATVQAEASAEFLKAKNVPFIGGPATVSLHSDCHAGTVIAISKSGHKVTVQADTATVISGNGADGSAVYTYERNEQGRTEIATRRQDGSYRLQGWDRGGFVNFLGRREYRDPSF